MTDSLTHQERRGFNLFSWFQPRSTDRDEAFRERIIRIALALLLSGTLLSLLSTIFVYQDDWAILSYPSNHIYAILLYIGSAWAVMTKRFVLAGWLLSFGMLLLILIMLVLNLQQYLVLDSVSVTAFMLVPLISTLVLPRNYILVFTAMTAISYSLLELVIQSDGSGMSRVISMSLLVSLAGALLYQFRTEFDARLKVMTESFDKEHIAKAAAESARQRAEDADRAKSQFLANMSHELRTPLNAIIGYDEAMLGGMVGEFTPKQQQLLGHIQYNSRRLLGLINDILDLSKIESGSLNVFASPMSPRQLLNRTVESLASLAQEKSLTIDVHIDENAPELVISDEKKIEQVLINLIGNAIKFTTAGGVYIRVQSLNHQQWQIEVRDTGIGIADDKLKLIFEPFQQVDNSSTRKFKGTGLGLTISKALIEIINGQIDVVSELGKGTTFTLTLARSLQKDLTLEPQAQASAAASEYPIVS